MKNNIFIITVFTILSCICVGHLFAEKDAILIIGGSWVQVKYFSKAANALGYRPIFIGNIEGLSSQVEKQVQECESYQIDIQSYEKIKLFLKQHEQSLGNIKAITSFSDSKLPIAIELAKEKDVLGPDVAILELTSKAKVIEWIPEFSPWTLPFYLKSIPIEKICEQIEKQGKVVIKPAKGTAGLGTVFLSSSISSLELEELLKNCGITNAENVEWIAQEYIDGTLYSMEGYCLQGSPTFLGLSRRSRIHTTEMGSYFPADADLLLKPHLEQMKKGVTTLIERSQYQNGYFHCEFLVSSFGAYIIDANFGRMGGGALIECFSHSFGRKPEELLQDVILVGVFAGKGRDNSLYSSPRKPAVTVNYGVSKTSKIDHVQIPVSMQSYSTIIAKEGSTVTAIGSSDYSWIGSLAGDPNIAELEVQKIQVFTNEEILAPTFFMSK